MTKLILIITLNNPHDASPDTNLPSRRCRSFDTVFMSFFRYVTLLNGSRNNNYISRQATVKFQFLEEPPKHDQ